MKASCSLAQVRPALAEFPSIHVGWSVPCFLSPTYLGCHLKIPRVIRYFNPTFSWICSIRTVLLTEAHWGSFILEPDVKQLSGQDPPKEVELEDAEEGELESLVRGGRALGWWDDGYDRCFLELVWFVVWSCSVLCCLDDGTVDWMAQVFWFLSVSEKKHRNEGEAHHSFNWMGQRTACGFDFG